MRYDDFLHALAACIVCPHRRIAEAAPSGARTAPIGNAFVMSADHKLALNGKVAACGTDGRLFYIYQALHTR